MRLQLPVTTASADGEAVRQVHRNHVELRGRAALQEQDFVVGRNVQQRAQVLFGVMEDAEEHFRAVTHRHDGEACAVVVKHFLLRGTQYGFGQDADLRKSCRWGGRTWQCLFVSMITALDFRMTACFVQAVWKGMGSLKKKGWK